jgi:CRISPR-associated endonuclease/helicase Cas3
LVSTQLVEAGVDIDFPVVFRALGGVDSLLQAGGRCNREGGQANGRLVIFRAPTEPPPGVPLQGMQVTEMLLRRYGGGVDLFDSDVVTEYFRLLYQGTDLDQRGIRGQQSELSFATVAARFHLIQDGYTRPVVVPWGEGPERLERFRREGPSRESLRALQPFVVNVPERHLLELLSQGAVASVHDAVHCLSPDAAGLYQDQYGFVFEPGGTPGRSALVV